MQAPGPVVRARRCAVGHALQVVGLRRLIIKDDTAACFNRRYFEEFLPEELARAARFRSPVSLIFLDMDNLKEVNTLHGHSMGSQTLLEVSRRIRNRIRKFDKLFRFGGDEFCIVLPETEWHGAVEVAERVREAITASAFLQEEIGGGGIGGAANGAGTPGARGAGSGSAPAPGLESAPSVGIPDKAGGSVAMVAVGACGGGARGGAGSAIAGCGS